MVQYTRPRPRYRRRPGSLPSGPVPYGYQRDATGHFTPDPATYPVVEHIVGWRARGSSLRALAEGLNADGVPAPSGGAWNAATVWNISRRGARWQAGVGLAKAEGLEPS